MSFLLSTSWCIYSCAGSGIKPTVFRSLYSYNTDAGLTWLAILNDAWETQLQPALHS